MPVNTRTLCISCMRPIDTSIGGGEICPHCGYNNKTPQVEGALPYRSFLKQRYVTGKVRSMNHEGITYAALDTQSGQRVNIREFFPHPHSRRDGRRVMPALGSEEVFRNLQREFESMSLNLSRLGTSSIILKITDVFRDGGTAYRVSEYKETISLEKYVARKGNLPWPKVSELFVPFISSLSRLETAGNMHLGISPKSIRYTREGKLLLDDFSIASVRQTGTALSPDLYPGCAAPEQYTKILSCGEVSDVYAVAASMVFALTGDTPASATERVRNPKLMLPKSIISTLPPNVLKALSGALQVREEQRTGSFERLRSELSGQIIERASMNETGAVRELPSTKQYTPQVRRGLPAKFWLVISFLFSACIMCGAAYYLVNYTDFSSKVIQYIYKVQEENTTTITESVLVPDMVGDKYNDWVALIKEDGGTYRFNIEKTSEEFSEEYPTGTIISTEPAANFRVSINGTVKATVSKGERYKSLPRIGGRKFTDVLQELQDMGFVVEKVESYSNDALSGIVLWYEDYLTGETVEYGTTIKVVVSIGKSPD